MVARFIEKRSYKKQGRLYPKLPRVNLGSRVISNALLIFAAIFFAMSLSDLAVDSRAVGGAVAMYSGFLALVAMMYVHCPRRYKKIQCISRVQPIDKVLLGIITYLISTFLFVCSMVIMFISFGV